MSFFQLPDKSACEAILHKAEESATDMLISVLGPNPDVEIVFHTYSGLLMYFWQVEHRTTLPALTALEYIKGLHRRNLKCCLVPYPGCFFVPVLSYLGSRKQIKKCRKAIAEEAL